MPTALALLCALAALALGCAEREHADGDAPPAEVSEDELERLRAVGYVDFVEADDAEPTGVVTWDRAATAPGHRLVTYRGLRRAELLAVDGRVVHAWEGAPPGIWGRAALLADGDLAVVATDAAPALTWPDETNFLMRLGWDGTLRWRRRIVAHHDVHEAADGSLLVLTHRRTPIPALHPSVPIREEWIARLDADGATLEERSLLAAIRARPDLLPLEPRKPGKFGGSPWVDLTHANSVEWIERPDLAGSHPLYGPGTVLVCMRNQDAVVALDWERGEIVWAWGRGRLSGPHDAQLLENGNVLVFDNGLGRRASRVLELDPRTGDVVWRYQAARPRDFYTAARGSAQRLPNGNTLVAESEKGVAFEVDGDGRIVWKWISPHTDARGRRAGIVRIIHHDRAIVPDAAR